MFPGRFRLDTIHDMNLADGIRAKVAGGAFEFSQHALDQSVYEPDPALWQGNRLRRS